MDQQRRESRLDVASVVVGILALFIAAGAFLVSCEANDEAETANDEAGEANDIATTALGKATQANEIADDANQLLDTTEARALYASAYAEYLVSEGEYRAIQRIVADQIYEQGPLGRECLTKRAQEDETVTDCPRTRSRSELLRARRAYNDSLEVLLFSATDEVRQAANDLTRQLDLKLIQPSGAVVISPKIARQRLRIEEGPGTFALFPKIRREIYREMGCDLSQDETWFNRRLNEAVNCDSGS